MVRVAPASSRRRDDVKAGIERAGREDDVDRALVRVDGGNQSLGSFDPRLLEDLFLGGVALDVKAPLGADALHGLLCLVDDNVGDLVVLKLGNDLGADAPVAADDVVVA